MRFAHLAIPLALAALALPLHAQPLKVSAIPDESPTELLRKFKPLGKYLEQKLGVAVQWTPVNDYPAVVEGLAARKLDLAWLGGFTFVQVRMRTGNAAPIVQRAEDEKFTSRFIVAAGSAVRSLKDLKGKTFVFGSPSSTSGHLMPRFFLLKEGIDPDRDFSRIAFSGAHDATLAFVASRRADGGALNASVWDKLVERGDPNAKAVRVIATTPPYHDYNWTVRGDLDRRMVEKLTEAFLALDPGNPVHKEILELQRASRFVPTRPENYKGIEEAARASGLLK
ncbi:MAG: putative selenate ABC transporter substrate-binding protein [Burkholderiales bacterium]